jgi:thiol:disulfide interchange protein DsbD
MKKIFVFIVLSITGYALNAQNPVSWSFSSKKISDKTYELHLTANIQYGWHLYSQEQPQDAIAIPTSVKINNNPLLKFDGRVKELGKMETFKDKTLGISQNQYSGNVDFVQVVKLKANARTNVSGSVEFQTCDDKKCLPPKTVTFNVALK